VGTDIFKINHLGKVKSSLMLNPELLTEAKTRAAQTHLTLGNVVEFALKDYLQKSKQAEEERARLKAQEEQQKEGEQVKRYNENGSGTPPSFIFRHYGLDNDNDDDGDDN
jgi:primosomal protein N'